ncbi:sensor histidine kinase [Sinomicrobium oceani]|uniref:sensor histidine kinase n=1 Tax=Sinomicrobium oceani TaxID=1150368 RepID=UPI00227C7061|nr:HAMP domain-containing sensor histidine kinase [Sinomicrobium oceani]
MEYEIEEELYSNKARIERILAKEGQFIDFESILQVKKVENKEAEAIQDTLIYDPSQDEIELFRQLSGTKEINGTIYKITVRSMIIESEDILSAIVLTFISIIFLAFIFLFYLNRSHNEKLWQPFFLNLGKLKNFSLRSDNPLELEDSEILEFHELNREVKILTSKIQTDYRNLKQFTEDVSHEMQTPLAIMQAKIDTVINDVEINETQFQQFSSLQSDISRLKQLNKKLILLAKIENDQFTTKEAISINNIVEDTIKNFKELTSIDIQLIANNTINVRMDLSLATVLCNNLLSNAVKHNLNNNSIHLKIFDTKLQVINSGDKALDQPNQIFQRFYKESRRKESTGLGLSIVKKICDYYSFAPSYCFETITQSELIKGRHIFQIDFYS